MAKYTLKCEQCKEKFEHFTTYRVMTNIKRFCTFCMAKKSRDRNREAYRVRLKRKKQLAQA